MTDWLARHTAEQIDGNVWACPVCGIHVLLNCHHDGVDYGSKLMPEAEAEKLRETSGLFTPRMFSCRECKCERELGPGCLIGHGGITCADCAGVDL
jgi:hypothetical protein